MQHKAIHVWNQKVLSEGTNSEYSFFSQRGERGSKYHYKQTIIGPPAKRHLNALAC